MKPSIGSTVLYKATDRDTQPKPAVILTLSNNVADLNVHGNGILQFVRNSPMAASFAEAKGGEWCLAV